ncbi:MAG TPA: hypothetical protein RMH85_06560 [Polyangiaceae bacterium LLY-WYZ-15_(1-7)]|nr:hypothetical protein [Polyangiaceae bacterium LLY-WYZ-15_(1-7)]HJL08138.1 hypothetical protein [Polyangiaceae bacterium LLY-WYZ-15_(1-7)]HJL38826.1 hypothetical protein [Polyangiaceae bacterium LLY-WYZ-15_(1-7)]
MSDDHSDPPPPAPASEPGSEHGELRARWRALRERLGVPCDPVPAEERRALGPRFGFEPGDDADALLAAGWPRRPVERFGRRFFPRLDEGTPGGALPLQDPSAPDAIVRAPDGSIRVRQAGEGLRAEALLPDLAAFVDAFHALLEEARFGPDAAPAPTDDAPWLHPDAEAALRARLPGDADALLLRFGLTTLADHRHYLHGERKSATILALAGALFLALTLLLLVAPFGRFAGRAAVTVVVGCVPLTLLAFGLRARAEAAARLAALPPS